MVASDLESTREMVDFFASNGEAQSQIHPRYFEPDSSNFVESVRRVWRRVYDQLHSLPSSMAPRKILATQLWTDLGQKCRVNMRAPPEARTHREYSGVWSKDMGCAWRECLCSGERPLHKLRMCKGCENVLYCSTKCQRRDWTEGGHRSACRPPFG
ncbi:uncharacterized protein PHACADRAFT_254948 [Phanerochaete carnosa HHB-10118-sp]|uniref:MYND-type domain-containing protein n=1 Tax=Phanerochaete carnosa (strain HHB-10118-sp) TaxID=650164 RepID=K5W0A8_PHACS|nr:uncharacterized protein PHACADRAFT_254948 [Phanerochaete carnosa HHB-10118-sp]EKM57268.1 hypothetical protein PHACADRAFT_254948 [Phanerochaete carnosa HHB-10118-sp]